MAAYINLSFQGTFYFAAYRSAEDGAVLKLFSSTLEGVAREHTFDALYSRVGQDWHQQDDVATPFNDRRWSHVRSVWTFDLDGDILRLDKTNLNLWVSLSLVRQRSITMSDFEPYKTLPVLAHHALQSEYLAPYWKMERRRIDLQRLQRRKAFISRIFADFAFQWRHVFCGHYNNFTFRRLAYAIVRIITLDFTIKEATQSRQGIGGFLVWIDSLPEWDFASEQIVRVGRTSIVMCQHTRHAVTIIQRDFAKHILSTPDVAHTGLTYLILSVRDLIQYRINSGHVRYTEPQRLFDGTEPPPDEAIELILQATQTSAPTSPLHKIPVELQDTILNNVSAGPIESARVGCVLDIGSVFTWRSGNRDVDREEGRRSRTPWSPVESHILFGGFSSGIAYK